MTIVGEIEPDQMHAICKNERTMTGPGQTVLVFQGGGALGAYQAGVYHALHEAEIEPDWIIGTSIGAINASIIAGNPSPDRLPKLEEFWRRVRLRLPCAWPGLFEAMSDWATLTHGVAGMFTPNPFASLGLHFPLGTQRAAFYSTMPLERTLQGLVDFSLINRCSLRLTVGAAHVRTSEMRYFDSRDMPLTVRHVMASAALPPAFPAVRIDGEYYWDGGILSNTPAEAVFEDYPRRDSLVFVVNMWNPMGSEPKSISEVLHRHKDIQYSSRVATHIVRQKQIHRLRHVISALVGHVPEQVRNRPEVQALAGYGCVTRMHVVTLLAPRLENEGHSKDIDFSPSGIQLRWEAGYADTCDTLEKAPWEKEFDPIEGVILHEPVPARSSEGRRP
jgi:NTE family protein